MYYHKLYDFEGPYYVGKGRLLFGAPIEKWRIPIDDETLDRSIKEAEEEFNHRNYNIVCSNCHFFAATALKKAGFKLPFCCCCKIEDWTTCATFKIALCMVLYGRTIKWNSKLCVWFGFLIFWGIIIFIILLAKNIIKF